MTTIGILHPGAMGASIGAALRSSGLDVRWCSTGRSSSTRMRAEAAGLTDTVDVAALAAASDIVLSICPPEAAVAVAMSVADAGFEGVYVDANAISPSTAREVAATVASRGATAVDGAVIGPPVRATGTTRLYLSGAHADGVAAIFASSALDARVVGGDVGHASALKMAYAAYTKGTAALLLAIRATARHDGVEDALVAEWGISQPDLVAISEVAAAHAGPKAWRWVHELEEIGRTMADAGQPDGFGMAAAQVYRRLDGCRDASSLSLDEVLAQLAVPR